MRKVLSLFILAIMLFSLSSCDGMIDFMGKMGGNIMGANVEKVQDVANKITVSSDNVTDISNDKNQDGSYKFVIADGLPSITIDSETMRKVTTTLPAIDKSVVKDIADIRSNENIAVFVDEMSVAADGEVAKAAQGTAIIMDAVLDSVTGQINDALASMGDDNPIVSTISDTINNLKNSISSIADGTVTATKADVVTLQLIESFAKDASSLANNIVESGSDITEIINSSENNIIESVNDLVVVTAALSPASVFDLDLQAIVSGVMNGLSGMQEEEQIEDRSIADVEGFDIAPFAPAIRSLYYSFGDVAGSDFENRVSFLGTHKSVYETYANVSEAGQVFEFDSYLALLQYVASSILSEANRYYQLILSDDSILESLGLLEYKNELPVDVWTIVEEFAKANDWVRNLKAPVKLVIPERYEKLYEALSSISNSNSGNALSTLFKNPNNNAPTIATLKTLKIMINHVDISGLLNLISKYTKDFDLENELDKAISWFEN